MDDETRRFRITHTFHPLHGKELELINYTHCWGDYRVFYADETGRLHSLSASWTDVEPGDSFVEISAGRSKFRIKDLLELSKFLRDLEQ